LAATPEQPSIMHTGDTDQPVVYTLIADPEYSPASYIAKINAHSTINCFHRAKPVVVVQQ